jgi:hypothetical protein
MNEDINLNQPQDPSSIMLCLAGEKINENIEIIKISKEGFFYKGEKVEDIHNIYERFNEWLSGAEAQKESRQQNEQNHNSKIE